MVHDIKSWLQIEAFIYSRLKGREICQRALLGPPPRSTIILLRALRSASFETSQDGVNKKPIHGGSILAKMDSRIPTAPARTAKMAQPEEKFKGWRCRPRH